MAALVPASGAPSISLGKSPKLTDLVSDWLRRQIVTGQLKEGDFLPPEPELMAQLGVSRPTLREALRVLEGEQLIQTRRGSRTGARIQAPSFELSARSMGLFLQYESVTLEDVHRARVFLEPPLAGLVAKNKTAKTIESLNEVLEAEAEALGDDVVHSHAATRFHERIADLAGIRTLAVSVKQCNWLIDRHLQRVIESRSDEERAETASNAKASFQSHVRLVDMLKTSNAQEVERYWRNHIEHVGRIVLSGRRLEIVDLFD